MANGYNGWSNYETWDFMIHYGYVLAELASDLKEADEEEETIDAQLHTEIDTILDDIYDTLDNGLAKDLYTSATQEINQQEVINSTLDDLK